MQDEPYSRVRDQEIRAALDRHWAASDASDFEKLSGTADSGEAER